MACGRLGDRHGQDEMVFENVILNMPYHFSQVEAAARLMVVGATTLFRDRRNNWLGRVEVEWVGRNPLHATTTSSRVDTSGQTVSPVLSPHPQVLIITSLFIVLHYCPLCFCHFLVLYLFLTVIFFIAYLSVHSMYSLFHLHELLHLSIRTIHIPSSFYLFFCLVLYSLYNVSAQFLSNFLIEFLYPCGYLSSCVV